ncbi:unnamed protein product [Peronospora belbahrii]|uniref:Uncharacterized protein n=1 Tax=Peronospora belbahrii TaxID=622444 RepID=A0ABN8CMH0_9STRA|nr:unnamed protein product [Peronospora belbahrii]
MKLYQAISLVAVAAQFSDASICSLLPKLNGWHIRSKKTFESSGQSTGLSNEVLHLTQDPGSASAIYEDAMVDIH